MSFITISEFGGILQNGVIGIQAPMTPPIAEQTIEIGIGSEQSAPFTGNLIMIHTSVSVALAFGSDPEAKPNVHVMGPGDRFYGVNPGHKLAVILADE